MCLEKPKVVIDAERSLIKSKRRIEVAEEIIKKYEKSVEKLKSYIGKAVTTKQGGIVIVKDFRKNDNGDLIAYGFGFGQLTGEWLDGADNIEHCPYVSDLSHISTLDEIQPFVLREMKKRNYMPGNFKCISGFENYLGADTSLDRELEIHVGEYGDGEFFGRFSLQGDDDFFFDSSIEEPWGKLYETVLGDVDGICVMQAAAESSVKLMQDGKEALSINKDYLKSAFEFFDYSTAAYHSGWLKDYENNAYKKPSSIKIGDFDLTKEFLKKVLELI